MNLTIASTGGRAPPRRRPRPFKMRSPAAAHGSPPQDQRAGPGPGGSPGPSSPPDTSSGAGTAPPFRGIRASTRPWAVHTHNRRREARTARSSVPKPHRDVLPPSHDRRLDCRYPRASGSEHTMTDRPPSWYRLTTSTIRLPRVTHFAQIDAGLQGVSGSCGTFLATTSRRSSRHSLFDGGTRRGSPTRAG
jgi:hypothetical protein